MLKKILLLIMSLAAAAAAQTTCKSDVVQNITGHTVPQAQIYIGLNTCTGTPCSPLATIYTDATLASSITQPMVTDNRGGFAFCVATPGRYVRQVVYNGATLTDDKYVVAAADMSPGVFTSPGFADDGVTSGFVALINVPRAVTVTALHVRGLKAWTGCSVSPTLKLYGHPQSVGETSHLFATLTVQDAVHPVGQTSQHYFMNADLTGLALPISVGDELTLLWTPGTGCSQNADTIVATVNFEGSR